MSTDRLWLHFAKFIDDGELVLVRRRSCSSKRCHPSKGNICEATTTHGTPWIFWISLIRRNNVSMQGACTFFLLPFLEASVFFWGFYAFLLVECCLPSAAWIRPWGTTHVWLILLWLLAICGKETLSSFQHCRNSLWTLKFSFGAKYLYIACIL